MPVQQVAYYIPDDIAAGILRGVYKRFGGVIRDSKTGMIVKHLKEEDIFEKGGNIVLQAVKQHPVVSIGIAFAATAGGAATAYMVKRKKEKQQRAGVPACIIQFERSLKRYLKAVNKGNLDEKRIDKLMEDLDGISGLEEAGQVSLDLSMKELKKLVQIIGGYTGKLAKANSVKLGNLKQTSPDSLKNLQGYLEIQKRILEKAA